MYYSRKSVISPGIKKKSMLKNAKVTSINNIDENLQKWLEYYRWTNPDAINGNRSVLY